MPHPLVLGVGQVSVRTTVELILLCQRGRKDDPDQRPIGTPIATRLEAVALGRMVPVAVTPGTGSVVIDVQQVELVDITPDDLESVLECLMLTLLRAVFGSVSLPFSALRVGAFSLTLLRGRRRKAPARDTGDCVRAVPGRVIGRRPQEAVVRCDACDNGEIRPYAETAAAA